MIFTEFITTGIIKVEVPDDSLIEVVTSTDYRDCYLT